MLKKVKKLYDKGQEKILQMKIHRDQKAGPGIEEAALLLFIAVIVIKKSDDVGGVVGDVFDKVVSSVKSGLGIS